MSIKLRNTASMRVHCEWNMDPFGIICEKVRVVFDTWTFFYYGYRKDFIDVSGRGCGWSHDGFASGSGFRRQDSWQNSSEGGRGSGYGEGKDS